MNLFAAQPPLTRIPGLDRRSWLKVAGLVWNHRPLYGALGLGIFFLGELRKQQLP